MSADGGNERDIEELAFGEVSSMKSFNEVRKERMASSSIDENDGQRWNVKAEDFAQEKWAHTGTA